MTAGTSYPALQNQRIIIIPDYSMRKPEDPVDYRRTLYWNPNAVADETGRFNATFFNNGHETRVKVSVAGVTPDGRIITGKY